MIYSHFYRIWMLAFVAWREARGEPEEGVIAVMWTVIERANNKATWEGDNIVGVITAKMQYSSITDPNDPQLTLFPKENDLTFMRYMELADKVISKLVVNPCPGADSYYSDSIPAPFWAKPSNFIRKIGHHSFHRVI